MSKLTAAYLAGFVDGEGHISIYPYVHKDRDNKVYYKVNFKVCNTNKELIESFKASYGGWIYTQNKSLYHAKHKTLYTWSLDSKNAELVLQTIYPYLRIKKRQCELVLERIRLSYKKDDGSSQRVIDIYNELKAMNTRGKPLHVERLTEETSKEEVIV